MFGIVVDEFVDQFGADLTHGGEVAQSQIIRRYLAQAIRIECGVRHFERP